MASTEERVKHLVYAGGLDPTNDLIQGERISVDEWAGEWVGSETAEGFKFAYFVNEQDDYRITLVIDPDRTFYKYEVNALDGSHETYQPMKTVEDVYIAEEK